MHFLQMQKIRETRSNRQSSMTGPWRGNLTRVMFMKYEDPNMEAYWNSLPAQVRATINESGIEICSLGMLMKLGDYYQNGNSGEK